MWAGARFILGGHSPTLPRLLQLQCCYNATMLQFTILADLGCTARSLLYCTDRYQRLSMSKVTIKSTICCNRKHSSPKCKMRQSVKMQNMESGGVEMGVRSMLQLRTRQMVPLSTPSKSQAAWTQSWIPSSTKCKIRNSKFSVDIELTSSMSVPLLLVGCLCLPIIQNILTKLFFQNIHISIMCLPPFACKQYIQWSVSQTRHPLMLTSAPINPILRLYCRQRLSTVLWHKV